MKRILLLTSLFLATLIGLLPFSSSQILAGDPITPIDQPFTKETLETFNPLVQQGDPALAQQLSTPGGIMTRVLVFAFPIAGMILFVMIIWGGFEMLSGAATKKSLDAGKQRVTAGIVGFVLLFASYWLVQIIEVVFSVNIF